MTTITIDELETRLRETIEQDERGGEAMQITRNGSVVAEISPTEPTANVTRPAESARTAWTQEERDAYWAEWDRLGAEISKTWPAGVSAVDAIREDRSRLDDSLARNDKLRDEG